MASRRLIWGTFAAVILVGLMAVLIGLVVKIRTVPMTDELTSTILGWIVAIVVAIVVIGLGAVFRRMYLLFGPLPKRRTCAR